MSQPRLTIAMAPASSVTLPEFVDIGTGDEAARLARADHETARRFAVEDVEHLVELSQHRGGQRVGGGSRLVEGQPREAVGIAGQAPVLHQCSRFR